MGDLSPNFSTSELACRHCGQCVLDPALVPALEELRAKAGTAVMIHCAYRCPAHNAEVPGAVADSTHLKGQGADLHIVGKSLAEMFLLAESVPAFKNGGIGVYDGNFIHVDVRGHRARWSRVHGKYGPLSALLPGLEGA